jgi:hypothetical protein
VSTVITDPTAEGAPNGAPSALRSVAGRAVASVAVVIVIVGTSVAIFFNPLWIGFEQGRASVPGITTHAADQVRTVTGSILADLLIGLPEFAVAVDGDPVLDAAERSDMVDVRNVLVPLATLYAAAIAVLVALVVANRRRTWVWRAIALGSGALAVVGIGVALVVTFFFDAAFLLFHLVLFPQGNFSFDPRTERLTPLFPDQFWTDSSIGVVGVGLTIAIAVLLVAGRRAAAVDPATEPANAGSSPN